MSTYRLCLTLVLFFAIGVLADLGPYFRSISYDHAGHGKWPHQSYHSSKYKGPVPNIQRHDDGCDNGQYVLLSIIGSEVDSVGPIILDNYGNLVWNNGSYGKNWGLDVQMLNEEPHLTFCSWQGVGTHVTCYILNTEYEEVYSLKPYYGWGADGTEFSITPQNTALLTTSRMIDYDLTPVKGPRHGRMRDVGLQEIDLETGKLLFEWSWSDHWNLTDVIRWPNATEGYPESPWDPFHINSAQKDSSGNYLVSSRHTSTVGYINGRSGDFIWTLGGKRNMFKDLSDGAATGISMQHHARFLKENTTLTLFDNAVSYDTIYQTKGLIIDIDTEAMTAKVQREYPSPHLIGSKSRGSMQILDNDNVLLGWGVNSGWSEFSMEGDLLCDVHFAPESRFGREDALSYRVLKRSWTGRPKVPPSAVHKGGDVYASWNGATEVASWALVAADADPKGYIAASVVLKEGFETRIPVPRNLTTTSLRAVGIDVHGGVLGVSSVLKLAEPAETNFQHPMGID